MPISFSTCFPGPRDRDGLPESIRFWKTRIEETDADTTFSVGLIYGPSGCGKSSLVKAGLLPRLAAHVLPIYVEATAEDTEVRLIKGLRKACPDIPDVISLPEVFESLREGVWIPVGGKLVVVLDQFEQWLHAKRGEQETQLLQALRHCDGGRVQCVFLVRDDFWLATSRFSRDLEVRLLDGDNAALVDLFDPMHARRVLGEFGRAYGRLPDNLAELTPEQNMLLDGAIQGLSLEGKVICVRLSLFADMIKGKPWTIETLKQVGGTEGLGVTFLEETFCASTAPAEHRFHQKPAQAVLRSLLPESGTDIKGGMRSQGQLLEAADYAGRERDFEDVVRILDTELRLITPTDPEGIEASGEDATDVRPKGKYYQLTHDYLVPSLREWLTRKQKETRRGRAELRLADRAALWSAKPENQQLPSVWEYANIRSLTARKNWTEPQRKMMRRATRLHTIRGCLALALLVIATATAVVIRNRVLEHQSRNYALALVERVIDAEIGQVPEIIAEFDGYRVWADPELRKELNNASVDSRQRLQASLALLPVDPSQIEYLKDRLLAATPQQVPVLRDALPATSRRTAGRALAGAGTTDGWANKPNACRCCGASRLRLRKLAVDRHSWSRRRRTGVCQPPCT